MSATASEKKTFVIKHVFKNVMDLENEKSYYGHRENHFSVPWAIEFFKGSESCFIDLRWCASITLEGKIIVGHATLKLFENGETKTFSTDIVRSPSVSSQKVWTTSEPENLKNHLINGDLSVEIEVEIARMKNIRKKNSEKFDDELTKKFSDVVLDVNGKKFYVNKMFLASHSSYFQSLFFGEFQESEKTEVELKDIDSWDFQNFLDLIYGETFVDDDTVLGILKLADMYDSKTARSRCLDFLIVNSKRSLTEKFTLALKYKMDELKGKFLSEAKASSDIRNVIPEDHTQLDTAVWKELLWKSLDLLLEKERRFGV